MAAPSQFDDTWELFPPKGFLVTENWKKKFKDNKFAKKVDLDRLATSAVGYFESSYLSRDQEYRFSCWTKTQTEHAGLWGLYTDWKNAVAVSTTPRAFFSSIAGASMMRQHVFIGCVEYIDFESEKFPELSDPIFTYADEIKPEHGSVLPLFYKRESYVFEDEVRIAMYCRDNDEVPNRIKCDPTILMDEIVVAPRANESFATHVKDFCQELLPSTRIRKSKLKYSTSVSDAGRDYMKKINNTREVQREKRLGFKFILFSSQKDFNTWHEKVNDFLGIPSIGRNAATGMYAFDKSGTSAWCEPMHQSDDDGDAVLAPATETISFGRKLLTRSECEKMGWFTAEKV